MLHYLLVGHFAHEDDHIRFVRDEPNRWMKRVVQKPLDLEVLRSVLRNMIGRDVDALFFPKDWGVRLDPDGVLTVNKYTHNGQAIDYLVRVARRTGAEIWDDSGVQKLTPEEVERDWNDREARMRRLRQK